MKMVRQCKTAPAEPEYINLDDISSNGDDSSTESSGGHTRLVKHKVAQCSGWFLHRSLLTVLAT